jgi:hypothetical protein
VQTNLLPYTQLEAGGIQPPTHVMPQRHTAHSDHIVT